MPPVTRLEFENEARRLGVPIPTRFNAKGVPDKRIAANKVYYRAVAEDTRRVARLGEIRRAQAGRRIAGAVARLRRPRPLFRLQYTTYRAFLEAVLPFRNQTFEAVFFTNGRLSDPPGNRQQPRLTIEPRPRKKDWISQWFDEYNGEATYFIPTTFGADEIRGFGAQQLVGRNIQQVFRDNESGTCFFDAVRKCINEKIENAKTKKTRYNYQTKLNQLNRFELKYPNGVSVSDIGKIAEDLGFHIEIEDILHTKLHTFGKPQHSIKIVLTNTRVNHIDLLTNQEAVKVTAAELEKIVQKNKNKFHIIRNGTNPPNNIETVDGYYVLDNPDQELINQVNDQIRHCRYDALQNPELNEFLRAGRIVNSETLKFDEYTSSTKLIDMKNAYTNHTSCPFYEGFLYQVQQFRPVDRIVGVGFYKVEVGQVNAFCQKLGMKYGQVLVMFSAEIRYFQKHHNVEFKIVAGAWGSVQDITYPSAFVEKKLYQKWTGKLSMPDNFHSTRYTFPANQEFAEMLRSQYENTKYWNHSGQATVEIAKKKVMVAHHIFGAITSYTRINMMIEMEKYKNIKAVQLDGIFLDDELSNVGPLFRKKDIKTFPEEFGEEIPYWYTDVIVSDGFAPKTSLITRSSALVGQGGSGKTTAVLTDKGYINPLYAVPTNELKEGKSNAITIHKLLGIQTEAYNVKNSPTVILVDEITMCRKEWIEAIPVMYPQALILYAGDLDRRQHYQCRGGSVTEPTEIWSIPDSMPVVEFVTDYRSKDEGLKKMKLDMRSEMQKVYMDGGVADTEKMRQYIRKNFAVIPLAQAVEEADADAIFMWSTHRVEKLIPETFVSKGVHMFQGQTIEDKKIYICMDFFEYAMPYTALSRARHSTQITFVQPPVMQRIDKFIYTCEDKAFPLYYVEIGHKKPKIPNNTYYRGSFATLEEAITFRDQFLKCL